VPPDAAGQARKLGLVGGSCVLVVGAPADWTLDDPPAGVEVRRRDVPLGAGGATDLGAAEVTIVFARSERELGIALRAIEACGVATPALWICWPRRAGGHESDLTDGVVRRAGLTLGLVDNKVAAVDADWSGLRFVTRREPR
jgi:hypothetical protein